MKTLGSEKRIFEFESRRTHLYVVGAVANDAKVNTPESKVVWKMAVAIADREMVEKYGEDWRKDPGERLSLAEIERRLR